MLQLFVVTAFVILSSVTLTSQDYSYLSIDNIQDSLTKNAYSVVRFHNITQELKSLNKLSVKESFAISVFNKRAKSLLNFSASYKESSSKVKDIKLIYLDKDGNTIKEVKKSDIEDYATSGNYFITGTRMKYYESNIEQYPVTIVAEFNYESENTNQLQDWRPFNSFRQSVEKSTYNIINNTHAKLEYEVFDNHFKIIKDHGNLNFGITNVKAVGKERYMPVLSDIFPIVRVRLNEFNYEGHKGHANDWNEIGMWRYKAFLEPNKAFEVEQINSELSPLIKDITDKRELAKFLYEYLQDNTRYVYVGLEDGGLNPMDSKDVHNLKYGDCKALSNYYIHLLKTYDIEANFTIIYADEYPVSMDPKFANHLQSNHIIVNIPFGSDTVWTECTSDDLPFGFLGDFTDDRLCLSVNENGGEVIKTPTYSFEQNKILHYLSVNVANTEETSINIKSENYGIPTYKKLKLTTLDNSSLDDYLKENLLDKFHKVTNLKTNINYKKEDLLLYEDYTFSCNNFVERLGNYLQFRHNLINLKLPILKKDKHREYPIYFPRDYMVEAVVEYEVPEGFALSSGINDSNIENLYGYYSFKLKSLENGKIRIHKIFKLNKGLYKASEYNSIKNFIDKIKKQEKTLITIQNRT